MGQHVRMVVLACLGAGGISPAVSAAPSPFRPEQFFAGRTHSSGVVSDSFGRPTGRVKGTTAGHHEPDGSTVFDQIIHMEDGSVRRRSFRLVRTGADTIDVTGSEVVGTAHGTIRGDTLHLASTIQSDPGNPFSTVEFDQRFTLQPDGRSLAVHSDIAVLGVTVRTIDERFVRASAARS